VSDVSVPLRRHSRRRLIGRQPLRAATPERTPRAADLGRADRFAKDYRQARCLEDEGRLPLVTSHVDRLVKSIGEVGLLEPIIVCRRGKRTPSLVLVAGRHRLEACRKLKHETILALVETEDSTALEQWRALAEIDENLIRRDLTAAQRAKLIARRKAAYEATHPETKHGGAPRGSSSKVEKLKKDRFTVETAQQKRTIDGVYRRGRDPCEGAWRRSGPERGAGAY
jgi:hypothetical protein